MARHQHGRYRKNRKPRPSFSSDPVTVTVTSIGQRGDGMASITQSDDGEERYFIRNSMVGDVLSVRPVRRHQSGLDAEIMSVITPSPDRITPDCPSAAECGGCQFQYMAKDHYQDWKFEMVRSSLSRADVTPDEWRPSFFAEYGGRRRTRLAWRRLKDGVICGFREARSHQIIAPDGCLVAHPELRQAMDTLKTHLLPHTDPSSQGEVEITLADAPLNQGQASAYLWDIAFRPQEAFKPKTITAMVTEASHHPIARLSQIHPSGDVELLYEKTPPVVTWSLDANGENTITLTPAAGSFMQADASAERHMQQHIYDALKGNKQIVDLFCGSGSLSLPLMTSPHPPEKIKGIDSAALGLEALMAAAKSNGHHHRVSVENRNLFKDPLNAEELSAFDAAIIDPPRAGAAAQMPAIANSNITRVMMVSCNPNSFARDAQILIQEGFQCRWAQMIDQFYLTAHAELIACFER